MLLFFFFAEYDSELNLNMCDCVWGLGVSVYLRDFILFYFFYFF